MSEIYRNISKQTLQVPFAKKSFKTGSNVGPGKTFEVAINAFSDPRGARRAKTALEEFLKKGLIERISGPYAPPGFPAPSRVNEATKPSDVLGNPPAQHEPTAPLADPAQPPAEPEQLEPPAPSLATPEQPEQPAPAVIEANAEEPDGTLNYLKADPKVSDEGWVLKHIKLQPTFDSESSAFMLNVVKDLPSGRNIEVSIRYSDGIEQSWKVGRQRRIEVYPKHSGYSGFSVEFKDSKTGELLLTGDWSRFE